MKKYVLLALLVALCSCGDNNTLAPTTKGEATLTLTGSTIGLLPTRDATFKNLADGTEVGVYALQKSGVITTLATTPYSNGLYRVNSEGAFVCAAPFVLYDGFSYAVCAYSPRLSTVETGATALPFNHGTDVLFAPSTDVAISGATASAALSFTHQLSQIAFSLVSGIGSPDLTDAVMTVSGFASSCTMNLTDGSITPVVGSGAVISQVATPTCFVPGVSVLTISVKTVDGKTYSGTLNRTFVAGSSYSFTLTLNKTETQLGVSGTVVNWVTVPSGDVELEDADLES